MPNISASDYTSFIKAQAASLAYRNGAIPKTVQTSSQPYAVQSVLNAQLLASKAAFLVQPPLGYPKSGTAVSGLARVIPYNGKGYVNQPKSLSTVHSSTSTVQSSGKFAQSGGLPLTAAKWDGVYAPVAHLARVDTKTTGAYKSVRQPV